jgi:hypothetical protein
MNPLKRTIKFISDVTKEFKAITKERKFYFELKSILPKYQFENKYGLMQTIPPEHYDCFLELIKWGWDFDTAYENVENIFDLTCKTENTIKDVVLSMDRMKDFKI